MRVHELKILNDFADSVATGDKQFEIRENDRGYQKGDYIRFQAIDKCRIENQHVINKRLYEITFVLSGWGLKNGWVALGIREVKEYEAEN